MRQQPLRTLARGLMPNMVRDLDNRFVLGLRSVILGTNSYPNNTGKLQPNI
jgi:hypothetical protein